MRKTYAHKSVAFLLALTILFCHALTGCGQNTDKAEPNMDNAEQSVTAEQESADAKEPDTTPDPEFKMPEDNLSTIGMGLQHSVALRTDGTVYATGSNQSGQCDVHEWTEIVSLDVGYYHTLGLRADGTVVTTGDSHKSMVYGIDEWTNIVEVSAGGNHTVGLHADGTVVAVGVSTSRDVGACDVEDWMNIVAVAAGGNHTVGLRADGTVVATGDDSAGACNVEGWTDIVAISTNDSHTVGLRSDGTVVATGFNGYFKACEVDEWTDIVAIDAGPLATAGVRADGTVVVTDWALAEDVSGWTDVVDIRVGAGILGLRADGTVVTAGANPDGECNVSGWTNIRLPNGQIPESSTPATEGIGASGVGDRVSDYVGSWDGGERGEMDVSDDGPDLTLNLRFYRLVAFEVMLVSQDEPDGSWRFAGDGFIVHFYPNGDTVTLTVDASGTGFEESFRGMEFVFTRNGNRSSSAFGTDEWLGKWVSADGNGEYIEVTDVDVYGIELTFHRLTASGESYIDTDYSLTFAGTTGRWAVEDASVIDASGWRYSFELNDGYIIAYSRYPDQRFNKE